MQNSITMSAREAEEQQYNASRKRMAAARKAAKAVATQGHQVGLPTTSTAAPSKLSQVAAYYQAGKFREALAIAARFPQLGAEANAIRLGHEAYTNPGFYAQLGKNVAELKSTAIVALAMKYGWAMQPITDAQLNPCR